jgi:penicillin G amidase
MQRTMLFVLFAVTGLLNLAGFTAIAADLTARGGPVRLPGLTSPASVVTDANGIAHIHARNEQDLFFLQGYVHARDRIFQMDQNRRLASGTLAELLGPDALAGDVQFRTIGLRRAATLSVEAMDRKTRAALDAYTRGVNAWLGTNRLPPEYGPLELSNIPPWTPTDSVVIGKLVSFSLSFESDIDRTLALKSYVAAGAIDGFDGQKLYFEDLDRAAPFDLAATVPDASVRGHRPSGRHEHGPFDISWMRPEAMALGAGQVKKMRAVQIMRRVMDRNKHEGSNLWAVSGRLSATGRPIVANDPHLPLGTPSTFYPMGLQTDHGFLAFGSTLPGVPGIVLGYNRHISWGATNNLIDVTDTFQEQVTADPDSPSGLATLHEGLLEPVIPIPEVFRANQPDNGVADDLVTVPAGGDIPAVTLIVPRRNNGPIISLDSMSGVALSVQYTGFGATHEVEAFLKIDRAANLHEFVEALQFIDFGSQNFVYGDDRGNIAYFTSGEMPVREDLQAGSIDGAPPWFIRNGQGGNEWLPVQHPQPHQVLPYEILPFAEMPKVVNPSVGWLVNANNDPAGLTLDNNPLSRLRPGGGILYLAYAWDRGFRAGRVTDRIRQALSHGDRRLSFKEMQSIQADVILRDAEYFTPWLVRAYANGQSAGADPLLAALAADPAVAEAAKRLAEWNYSTPTGLSEGWDAGKPAGVAPSQANIDASVAASIYAVWRSRFIANTVDATLLPAGLPVPDSEEVLTALRSLLDNFAVNGGNGFSGVNFFSVPGVVGADDRRDIILLQSLQEALQLMAGESFASAFSLSADQNEYRWGRLHRIVFAHPLGAPFSIPPAGGEFPAPLPPGLDGIPTDGGFQTVDAASHDVRGTGSDGFRFDLGPVRRFVSEPGHGAARTESIWPGGTSGVLGSRSYFQFLPSWLQNRAIPLTLDEQELRRKAIGREQFIPARR